MNRKGCLEGKAAGCEGGTHEKNGMITRRATMSCLPGCESLRGQRGGAEVPTKNVGGSIEERDRTPSMKSGGWKGKIHEKHRIITKTGARGLRRHQGKQALMTPPMRAAFRARVGCRCSMGSAEGPNSAEVKTRTQNCGGQAPFGQQCLSFGGVEIGRAGLRSGANGTWKNLGQERG
jgi:hypothetical protein